jgi:hypothetical protein
MQTQTELEMYQIIYIVKFSTLSCTVGVPLSTLMGEAKEDVRTVRTQVTSGSGPETTELS